MDKLVGRVYRIVCNTTIKQYIGQSILLNSDYNDMRKHIQVM